MAKRKAKVPVPDNPFHTETLEGFARCVEQRLAKHHKLGPFATQRLMCRLLTSKNPNIAMQALFKQLEYRYGKKPEENMGQVTVILRDVINIQVEGGMDAAQEKWLGRGTEAEHQGDAGSGASSQPVSRSRLLNAAPSESEREVS